MANRLKYLTVGEIREEIAYAAGADPGRFEAGSQRGLRRDTLRRIAEQVRPEESDLDIHECHLPELYESICEWLNVEYEHNAGNPWSLNRPQLKAIHRSLDASDPREVPEVRADGGAEKTGTEQVESECPLCHGSAELGGSVCEACGGYGTVYRLRRGESDDP